MFSAYLKMFGGFPCIMNKLIIVKNAKKKRKLKIKKSLKICIFAFGFCVFVLHFICQCEGKTRENASCFHVELLIFFIA